MSRHQATFNFIPGQEEIALSVGSTITIVCARKDVTIPPNTEMHVEASFARVSVNHVVTVEPFDHSKQGFAVANSVSKVKVDALSIVRVANPTNQPIRLSRGQPLADATIVDSNSFFSTPDKPFMNRSNNLSSDIGQLYINLNLSSAERASVLNVINQHQDAFGWVQNDFGRTNLIEHSIELNTNEPIKIAPYKTQAFKQRVIDE
jgi:hypothetical protein